MPCLSYDTEWFDSKRSRNTEAIKLKAECDKLARIACKAMTALEKTDPEFKSIKDQETRKWWAVHQKADQERVAKEEKQKAKKEEADKIRQAALAKLTPEELEVMGLSKKGKK